MGSWAGRGALSRRCAGGRPYRQVLRMHGFVLPGSGQLLGSRAGWKAHSRCGTGGSLYRHLLRMRTQGPLATAADALCRCEGMGLWGHGGCLLICWEPAGCC